MNLGRKSLEILMGFALAAGPLLGAYVSKPAHSKTSHKYIHHIKKKSKPPTPGPTLPVGDLDLEKESYYVAVLQNGKFDFVAKSQNFDPDKPVELASHVKLLSAICVLDKMEQNPLLKTAENMQILRGAILESSNTKMDKLALIFADEPTEASVQKMLQDKAKSLELSSFNIKNACGNPEAKHNHGVRMESVGSTNDLFTMAAYLFEKHQKVMMDEVYNNISPRDHPTSYFFWTADRTSTEPNNVRSIVTKTKTAGTKDPEGRAAGFRSMISVVDAGDKTYYFYHDNPYGSTYSPSSKMGAFVEKVLQQQGVGESPQLASWFHTLEWTRFPSVAEGIKALDKSSGQTATLEPPKSNGPPIKLSNSDIHRASTALLAPRIVKVSAHTRRRPVHPKYRKKLAKRPKPKVLLR